MKVTKSQLERIIRESLNEQAGAGSNRQRAYELMSEVGPRLWELMTVLQLVADEEGDELWLQATQAAEEAYAEFETAAAVIMNN
jgi:hypothetical protein